MSETVAPYNLQRIMELQPPDFKRVYDSAFKRVAEKMRSRGFHCELTYGQILMTDLTEEEFVAAITFESGRVVPVLSWPTSRVLLVPDETV